MAAPADSDFGELSRDFAREAGGLLVELEAAVLASERAEDGASRRAAADGARRALHTLKGNAGFVGAAPLQAALHALEDVAAQLPRTAGGLLAAIDVLRGELGAMEAGHGAAAPSAALRALAAGTLPPARPAHAVGLGRSLLVRQARLDELVGAAAEVAVLVSQLQRALGAAGGGARPLLDRLTASARALHGSALAARSLPVKQLFERYERLARDDAERLGRKVALHVVGGEVELDKSVLDGLAGALMHLVRNAVAHGVEAPAKRLQAGKREVGRVVLRARAHGTRAQLSVEDDGGGLDAAAVRRLAAERGLDARRPVEELIFEPGLSTAALSASAGRGIGLDAVRRDVLRLGGAVAVESTPGAGTTFRLEVPTSLALERGLVVDIGRTPYAVPLGAVEEAVPLAAGALRALGRGRAVEHRGELVPLLDVRLLDAGAAPARYLLIVRCGARLALPVTSIGEQHDLVFHPLDADVRGPSLVSAAALLGDGRLALRLDPEALAGAAHAQEAA